MQYSTVTGHQALRIALSKLTTADPTGTYLFSGPAGVGKRTVAFETARYILCNGSRSDDCECASCKRFGKNHPDFLCIGQKDRVKVDDVDRLLEFSSVSPFLSSRKVGVIDNADTMTWEAGNRLLKTLEEPSAGFVYIVVSSNPSSVIPTVLGRCVKFVFSPLSQEEVIDVIWKKLGFELPKARVLGWMAGSADIFSRAGAYLKYRDMAVDFVTGAKDRSLLDALDYVDKVEYGDVRVFMDMLVLVMTDVLLIKSGVSDIVNADLRDTLTKTAGTILVNPYVVFLAHLTQAGRYSYLNVNLNLSLKNVLLKSYHLLARSA